MEVLLKAQKALEESEKAMAEALRLLASRPGVEKVLVKTSHYLLEYRDELPLLKSLAFIAKRVEKIPCAELPDPYGHPVGAYVKARRVLLEARVKGEDCKELEEVVTAYRSVFSPWEERIVGRDVEDRSLYYYLLSPYVRLPYSGIKAKMNPPPFPLLEERELEDGSRALIYGGERPLYFLIPTEFKKPLEEEVDRLRKHIQIEDLYNRHIVVEIASHYSSMPEVVARNVAGLGPIEAFFSDNSIEDVYINGPDEAVVVKHSQYGELPTNLYVGIEELERWESFLRLITGRPFDELTPVIDGSLSIKGRVRFSGVKEPLSRAVAFAFRRHKEEVLTLPFLVKEGFISPKDASLLWLVVHGGRSMLIAGSRGSGKTTLLGALLFEMLPQHRMVIIEDTPELPVDVLKAEGYNVLSLLTRQSIGQGFGMSPQDVLRASLRLGDSALVVGEVRGEEARVLYEAMRVGALSNFVGGTIHGESPIGVFERVTNDLGVPKSSFKATDVIVMLELSHDISHKRTRRRVKGVLYQDKHWKEEPSFIPLEESPLLGEVARRHGLDEAEMVEILSAREEYYRYLALKGAYGPSQVVEANRAFLDVVGRFERMDSEKIISAFKEVVRV